MNIPGDHTCIIEDDVHLLYNSINKKAETEDCSDMECYCTESPKRLFYNGKFQDSENDCVLVGEESPNLECSTLREAPIKYPSQSAVRRLFEEKPTQRRQEDIVYATSPMDSRQLTKVIQCEMSPILFIESDETDSSADMSSNVQVNSSQKSGVQEENMPEVELLSEIHGRKLDLEQLDADFHDLPTPPRLGKITVSCENMFGNARKSLDGLLESQNICDEVTPKRPKSASKLSFKMIGKARKSLDGLLESPGLCDKLTPKRPKSASKLSFKQLENSDSRIPGIEPKEDGQKLQEKVNLHDLPTPKRANDSVKLKDNSVDKCRPRPAVCGRENRNPQEFRSEDSLNENSKTYNSRRNDTSAAGGISNRLIQIISKDNLRQIGPFSISRIDGSSSSIELEEHSSEPKKPVLLLGCGKNGLSLTNVSTESCERRSDITRENLFVRSSQISDISNRNSEPLEIDLVSDSSDEETFSPYSKRIEYDSRKTDSVISASRTSPNNRDALLAFSRAQWKARNKIYTSPETTESIVTKHSLDSCELETFKHRIPSSHNVSDPNTTKKTYSISRTSKYDKQNAACVKQDKCNDVNSTLHENVDFIYPTVQDRSTLKPAVVNEDPLPSECSPKSINKVFSFRNSNIGAGDCESPTPKEKKVVHLPKQIFPSERFSQAFNQENIALSVSHQQSTTPDKERCVVECVSPQSNIVPGHLNEGSRAGSETGNTSMPVNLQSCDVRFDGNCIKRTVHDRATHTIRSVSDSQLSKCQLESKSSGVEASALLCNPTVSQKLEKDRSALSNAPNQDQPTLCYSVNAPDSQSRNEMLPVLEVLDSTVLSRCSTSPEILPSEVINYFPERRDSAVHSTKCLTQPKFSVPSHLSAHSVPSDRSSRDVSFTVDQSYLGSVSAEFSQLSPTHRRIVTSNCSSTAGTNIRINSSTVDSSNSIVKESSADPLSGARDVLPSKEKDESQEIAINFGNKDDCHINRTSQSRNESTMRRTYVSSLSDSSMYFEVLKKTPVVKLRRLDESTIQSHLKSMHTSPKEDSENLKDGSKKRKTCTPKKLYSSEKYSTCRSSNDMEKTPNQVSSSGVNESDVTCGTLNPVCVRSHVSAAKTNQQLLRRKMFSVAWGDHREDLVAQKSNGLLMNHEKQTPERTNTSSDRKNVSENEAVGKEDRNITENTKRKVLGGNGGKRGLKRCDVCWRRVENVTEHIISDHSDMFYSKNNL